MGTALPGAGFVDLTVSPGKWGNKRSREIEEQI